MTPPFTRVVAQLSQANPFLGPAELERRRGRPFRARLGSNECLFGTSPSAVQLLRDCEGIANLYADPTHRKLRHKLAAIWSRPAEDFLAAAGIEGLLDLFVRAFVESGDSAVTSHGAFVGFDYYVLGYGGRLIHVPYSRGYWNDLEGMISAAREHRAKFVYLANPDNPTGLLVAPDRIVALLAALPSDCLLLLDEAYVEYAAQEILPLAFVHPKLVRFRTFSKAYGLANLRVGYAAAPADIVRKLDGIRSHFAVSGIAQELALRVLDDETFLARIVQQTSEGREHLAEIARACGLSTLPSSGNFVSFEFGSSEAADRAAALLDEQDIFVMRPRARPLDRLIRVTVGPRHDRERFRDAMNSSVMNP